MPDEPRDQSKKPEPDGPLTDEQLDQVAGGWKAEPPPQKPTPRKANVGGGHDGNG